MLLEEAERLMSKSNLYIKQNKRGRYEKKIKRPLIFV